MKKQIYLLIAVNVSLLTVIVVTLTTKTTKAVPSGAVYDVDIEKMTGAINSLSRLILTLQGNGDYQGVDKLVKTSGIVSLTLKEDLARLESANIPVDIVFEQ